MNAPRTIRRSLRRLALAWLELRERRRGDRQEMVWILGHMRSGSTLLMHLLSSHPEILGAGERNATYASARDLRRLAVDVAYLRRRFFGRYRFVVDQINHNRFLAAEDLLDHPRIARIFLVREPESALASMVEVLGRHYGMTPSEAVAYYLERLSALERYARGVADKRRSLFLTYDDLVHRSAPTLERLRSFLDLRAPLSESYRIFNFTGKRGDPSPRIASGRIQKVRRQGLDLEAGDRARVEQAYSRCVRALSENALG